MSKLYGKLASITGSIAGKLRPDKTNTSQRYDYISSDLVLQEIGKLLGEYGIIIIPAVTCEAVETIEYTDNYGKPKSRYDAVIEFDMTIADDETQIVMHWVGRGNDYAVPDKALYKAMTSGHKYFLMKLFNVGVGNDDGEHDSSEIDDTPAPQPKPKPQITETQQKPSADQMKALHAAGSAVYGDEWDSKRPELVKAITKGRSSSSKHLTLDEWKRLIDGINAKADSQ